MHIDSHAKRRTFWITVLLAVMLPLVLAACGGSISPYEAGGTSSAHSTITMSTPSISQNSGTAYGCPSSLVVKNAPSKANVIVQQKNMNHTIVAHKGDIIEVELPFGNIWTRSTVTQSVLQLQQPAGYVWKSSNMCVWRYVATGYGSEKLRFIEQALCRNRMCPTSPELVSFTIDVKSRDFPY